MGKLRHRVGKQLSGFNLLTEPGWAAGLSISLLCCIPLASTGDLCCCVNPPLFPFWEACSSMLLLNVRLPEAMEIRQQKILFLPLSGLTWASLREGALQGVGIPPMCTDNAFLGAARFVPQQDTSLFYLVISFNNIKWLWVDFHCRLRPTPLCPHGLL